MVDFSLNSKNGFALIEVLVAVFVLSFGLLGLVGMQLSALRMTQESYWQSVATVQLSSMLDRLRANQSPDHRELEFQRWNQSNARLLPHGKGSYRCELGTCTVSVGWRGREVKQESLSTRE